MQRACLGLSLRAPEIQDPSLDEDLLVEGPEDVGGSSLRSVFRKQPQANNMSSIDAGVFSPSPIVSTPDMVLCSLRGGFAELHVCLAARGESRGHHAAKAGLALAVWGSTPFVVFGD